jgi:inner membrane protein
VAVGLCTSRWRHAGAWHWKAAVGWSVLSLCPDLDVLAFVFRIPYESPWGHRGFTHSITFALLLGALLGVLLKDRRAALLGFLTVVSHPLLDSLTNGGLGVALFWPFTHARFFAPWQPLPVSPIGRAFFTPRGLAVASAELWMLLPFWLYALWPRAKRSSQGRNKVPSRT